MWPGVAASFKRQFQHSWSCIPVFSFKAKRSHWHSDGTSCGLVLLKPWVSNEFRFRSGWRTRCLTRERCPARQAGKETYKPKRGHQGTVTANCVRPFIWNIHSSGLNKIPCYPFISSDLWHSSPAIPTHRSVHLRHPTSDKPSSFVPDVPEDGSKKLHVLALLHRQQRQETSRVPIPHPVLDVGTSGVTFWWRLNAKLLLTYYHDESYLPLSLQINRRAIWLTRTKDQSLNMSWCVGSGETDSIHSLSDPDREQPASFPELRYNTFVCLISERRPDI